MASKQKRIEKYNLNPTLCKLCQKTLDYIKRNSTFCNASCAASYNNSKRCKPKFCLCCNKKLQGSRPETENRFLYWTLPFGTDISLLFDVDSEIRKIEHNRKIWT